VTKLEEAARAIFEHRQFKAPVPWVERGNSFKQDEARDYARAVVLALRKPSEVMTQAILAAQHAQYVEARFLTNEPMNLASQGWVGGIDAILNEKA
jgi:hypothetical protein